MTLLNTWFLDFPPKKMAPRTADMQQSTENISRQNVLDQLLYSDEARVQKSEQNLEEGGG